MAVQVFLDAFDGGFVAEGLMGERWNGWQVPLFTKSQAHKAWSRMSEQDSWGGAYGYDEEGDFFFWESEGQRSEYGPIHIRREVGDKDFSYTAYSLGGWEWTWVLDNGEMEIE